MSKENRARELTRYALRSTVDGAASTISSYFLAFSEVVDNTPCLSTKCLLIDFQAFLCTSLHAANKFAEPEPALTICHHRLSPL